MIRLFIALEIPENIRQKISELKDDAVDSLLNFMWESTEKLHLTIKFIGEVKDENVNSIIDSLSFLNQYEKIKCSLTKFGFFFRQGVPRILWIGLKVDTILFNIVEQLNIKLTKFEVPVEERKFIPHLTLLRIKKRFPEEWVTKFNSFIIPQTDFTADNICLLKASYYLIHPNIQY